MEGNTVGGDAERLLVSYRAVEADREDSEWVLADSGWIRDALDERSYRRYLRVVHGGPVAVGDEWREFVNCGCASPMDVVLRVEAVEGGTRLGDETAIDFVPRRDVVEERVAASG